MYTSLDFTSLLPARLTLILIVFAVAAHRVYKDQTLGRGDFSVVKALAHASLKTEFEFPGSV